MDEQTFNRRLRALIEEISVLPEVEQRRLFPLVEKTKEQRNNLLIAVSNFQQSLDALRLLIKYLVFDLEATRRERDELKAMLLDEDGPDTECGEQ